MTDATQPSMDSVGVTRTETGEIVTPTAETTTPAPKAESTGQTLLTEETKPEAKPETKPETKAEVPEKYEYKVPEGFTLDADTQTKIDAKFKDLGLSQDAAQSLVDMYIEQTTEAAQAPYAAYKEMTDGWRKDAEAHPDLRGKLGPGQEVNVRISKALDSLGDAQLVKDFKSLMDLTGAGNHPAFIRAIDKFAQRITEGTHVPGNGPTKDSQSAPGSAPPSTAAAMYPHLPSRGG